MSRTPHGGRLVFVLVVVIAVLWPGASAGAHARGQGPSAQEAWPPAPALVENINASTAPSNPTELTAAGEALFFVADDGIHGNDL